MKKILLLVAFISTLFFTSCSSDSGSEPTTITINADFTARYVNEVITFTATDGDGNNVTADAVFHVNNSAISGNTYTNATVGTYTVKATYDGATSQNLTVTFSAVPIPLTSISITPSAQTVEAGSPVTFICTGNNGTNLSSLSTFYVNGTQITGDTFTPTAAGTLNVYATHTPSGGTSLTAATIQVTVNPIINFNKRVLIEDFTGTWCGYCPRVAYAIEQVNAQTSDAVIVAIHRGNDPYNFSGASALETQINLQGYPTAMLNRNTEWNYPETSTASINQAVNLTSGTNPKIGVALTTSTSGNTSSVQVKVKFGTNFSNLKLVVYALEDNLIYNQTNYTSYYGGTSTIANFEHDNVVRAVLTSSILGEAITGNTNYNDEFSKSFTYTIPSNVNASNVHFVAVVLNSSNTALNSRSAGANATQSFEIE